MSEKGKKKQIISQEDIMKALDSCYEKAIDGIPLVSPTIEEMATDYLTKSDDYKSAIKAMIKNQVLKCTTSGVVTGFGGFVTMPITVPANVGSVLYVQIRMIACAAYMAGYDVKSDQVQTMIYACLAGVTISEVFKKAGLKIGEKVANNMINKIPGKTLAAINHKVGFRLVTKFGETGAVNLGKMVPGVGAVINGSFDYVQTRAIGKRAYKWFAENDFTADEKKKNDGPVDVEFVEVEFDEEDE